MARPLSIDIREQLVSAVDSGLTRRSPACRTADISDDLLRRLLAPSGFLTHLHALMVTMSQKSSFIQYPLSVSWALTPDTRAISDLTESLRIPKSGDF